MKKLFLLIVLCPVLAQGHTIFGDTPQAALVDCKLRGVVRVFAKDDTKICFMPLHCTRVGKVGDISDLDEYVSKQIAGAQKAKNSKDLNVVVFDKVEEQVEIDAACAESNCKDALACAKDESVTSVPVEE